MTLKVVAVARQAVTAPIDPFNAMLAAMEFEKCTRSLATASARMLPTDIRPVVVVSKRNLVVVNELKSSIALSMSSLMLICDSITLATFCIPGDCSLLATRSTCECVYN